MRKEATVIEIENIDGVILKPNVEHRSFYRLNNIKSDRHKPQHLYLISDEEIKDGDWCYDEYNKVIFQNNSIGIPGASKKVIATTNKSLMYKGKFNEKLQRKTFIDVAKINQDFVEAYVKAEGKIDKVMIEYDSQYVGKFNTDGIAWMPKTREDNTVIISKVKSDKVYSIDEVEDIHVAVMKQGCLYEGNKGWSDEHERLVRLEFNKWKTSDL